MATHNVGGFTESLWTAFEGASDAPEVRAINPDVVRIFEGIPTREIQGLLNRASELTDPPELQKTIQQLSEAFFKTQQECVFLKRDSRESIAKMASQLLQKNPEDQSALNLASEALDRESDRDALRATHVKELSEAASEMTAFAKPCLRIIELLGKKALEIAEERDCLLHPILETAIEKLKRLQKQPHHDSLSVEEARLKRMEWHINSHLTGYDFYPFVSQWAKDFQKLLQDPNMKELQDLVEKYEKAKKEKSDEFPQAAELVKRLLERNEAYSTVQTQATEGKELIDTFYLPLARLHILQASFAMLLSQISTDCTTVEAWGVHRNRIEDHKKNYENLKPAFEAITKLTIDSNEEQKQLQTVAAQKHEEFQTLLKQTDEAMANQKYDLDVKALETGFETLKQRVEAYLTEKKEALSNDELQALISKFCGQENPETCEGMLKALVAQKEELKKKPNEAFSKLDAQILEFAKKLNIIADAIKVQGFKPEAEKAQYEFKLGAGTWGYSTRYSSWWKTGQTEAPKENWWVKGTPPTPSKA